MHSVRLIWVLLVPLTKTSSCGLNYAHLLAWKQGVFGEGPALQHRPLQHTLPGGQHFVPQQLALRAQHILLLQQVCPLLQQSVPHAVWPLGQRLWGSGSGLPNPREGLPKLKDASTAPPTAPQTSLSVCRLEIGLAIIRDTSSSNALMGALL